MNPNINQKLEALRVHLLKERALLEGAETFAGIWRRKYIGDEPVRVTFERETKSKYGIPGSRWNISLDGKVFGSANEFDMKELANGDAVKMRDGIFLLDTDDLKKFKAWQADQ